LIQTRSESSCSGQTIKAVIGELNTFERPQHRLISLVETIARDGASNPNGAALQATEKIGSKCFLLPAPLLADSSEERKQWCRHRLYKVIEELSNQADVAFVGIGDMRFGCPMHRDGFITKEEVSELVKAGAVGDNLGWTFGQMGELVRISIQERVTSIQLPRPARKPVIGVCRWYTQGSGGTRRAARAMDQRTGYG
jgi:DNA-binding transcriptional regulator LsrR (DeoR family)